MRWNAPSPALPNPGFTLTGQEVLGVDKIAHLAAEALQ